MDGLEAWTLAGVGDPGLRRDGARAKNFSVSHGSSNLFTAMQDCIPTDLDLFFQCQASIDEAEAASCI